MQAMPDRVRLTGMRFSATHGVYDFERAQAQTFVVDVTCELQPRPDSDDLATTVDYAELSRAIAADVTGDPLNLIESLAERIALCEKITHDPRIKVTAFEQALGTAL